MPMIQTISDQLALPEDSDTLRAQKVLGLGMIVGGAMLSLFNAVIHALAGYTLAPLSLLTLAALLGLLTLLLWVWPAGFVYGGWLTGAITIILNVVSQLLTGGLTSGTYLIVWALVAVLGAALILGWRSAVFNLLTLAAGIIVAAVFTPEAQHFAAEAPLPARLAIGSFNLIAMGVYLGFSTMLLIRVIQQLRLRADTLLLNILPAAIAERLKQNAETIADGYSEVSVLFADIVDFTSLSADADPVEVVQLLNDIFSRFDDLAAQHGLEKIKTIGDEYMVASGLPEPRSDHAEAIAAFAEEMLEVVEQHPGVNGRPIQLRIGINSGPVVAGVIGRQKFIYDLWGDAVNVASRMESNGLVNQIQVTEAFKDKVAGRYTFTPRGPLPIKGKGMMVTYLLQPTSQAAV